MHHAPNLWIDFINEIGVGAQGSYRTLYATVRKEQQLGGLYDDCSLYTFIRKRQLEELAIAISMFVQGPARRLPVIQPLDVDFVQKGVGLPLREASLLVSLTCTLEASHNEDGHNAQEHADMLRKLSKVYDEAEVLLRRHRVFSPSAPFDARFTTTFKQMHELLVVWPFSTILRYIRVNFPGARGALYGLGGC